MLELLHMNNEIINTNTVKQKNKLALFGKFAGWALLLVLVVVLLIDSRKLKIVLDQANFWYLALALGMAILSISSAAMGFSTSAKIFKINQPWGKRFISGWLGVAINNLILSGGAVGYAARLKLLKGEQASVKQILSASLFHSFIFQILLASMFPFCLLYFYLHDISVLPQMKSILLVAVGFLFTLVMAGGVLLFLSSARKSFIVFLAKVINKIFKKDWTEKFLGFEELLDNSLVMANFWKIFLLVSFVVVDWIFCVFTLHFIFLAIGLSVSIWYIFAGLAIAIAIGFASVLPGGLGTQDLSLTGILVLAGYDLQMAIVAAILFRLIYCIIPYALASVYFNYKIQSKS